LALIVAQVATTMAAMTYVPQRWRDLHPGDLIRERWPMAQSERIAERLQFEGYRFRFFPEEDGTHLVGCVESPRPLTGNLE
jgi:hypothetical protein